MGRYVVEATSESAASPEAVWEVIADVSRWGEWGPHFETHLEAGSDPGGGIGAVRVYAVGPFRSREEVLVFDSPSHFAYGILSGFPAKDYRADVKLTPVDGGGVRINWRAEFDSKPPGTGPMMRILLHPYLGYLARKTGRVAETLHQG